MKKDEIIKQLNSRGYRPIGIRRVAELKGVTEGAVRKAIESGRLPAPIEIEGSGERKQWFFIWDQVKDWKPKQ